MKSKMLNILTKFKEFFFKWYIILNTFKKVKIFYLGNLILEMFNKRLFDKLFVDKVYLNQIMAFTKYQNK